MTTEPREDQARDSSLTITDLMMRVMSDFSDGYLTRCIIIAMNEDGTEGYIRSNAHSEPEMLGMLRLTISGWIKNMLDNGEDL